MTYGFVAYHYPAAEHFEEFLGHCHQVADTARGKPGCLSVQVWVTSDGDAVVSTAEFESEEAFQGLAEAGREMGATPDGLSDLEIKPRQVQFLVSR